MIPSLKKLLMGMMVSAIFAVVIRLITEELNKQGIISVGGYGSDVLGFVTFCFTCIVLLIVDLIQTVHKEAEITRRAIKLTGQLEDAPELRERIVKLVSEYKAAAATHPYAAHLLENQMKRFALRATDLAQGELRGISTGIANSEYTRDLFDRCHGRSTLLAVAAYPAGKWWEENLGKEYYSLCKKVVDKRADFFRIFVFADDTERKQHEGILKKQVEDGFRIAWILRADLPDPELEENFIVMKNLRDLKRCVVWISPSAPEPISKWNFSLNPERVEEFEKKFVRIEGEAHPLSPGHG